MIRARRSCNALLAGPRSSFTFGHPCGTRARGLRGALRPQFSAKLEAKAVGQSEVEHDEIHPNGHLLSGVGKVARQRDGTSVGPLVALLVTPSEATTDVEASAMDLVAAVDAVVAENSRIGSPLIDKIATVHICVSGHKGRSGCRSIR